MPPTEKPMAKAPAAPAQPATPPRKRVWQAPRIRTGHLFESNSLACGKNSQFLEQCMQNPTTS